MPIRLYCRTTRAAAAAILAFGFPEGRETRVWLSKDLDAVAEPGQWVLVVLLDMAEDVLEAFGRDVPTRATWDDETWDETTGRWVKRTGGGADQVRWYAVPSSILNGRITAQVLSPGAQGFRNESEELACRLVLELELELELDPGFDQDPLVEWGEPCRFETRCPGTGGSLPR